MDELPVIHTSHLHDYDLLDHTALEVGDLAIVASPCPARPMINAGSGVGGASITPCSLCGTIMGSTAGPHGPGEMLIPVRITDVAESKGRWIVSWRRLVVRDGVAI